MRSKFVCGSFVFENYSIKFIRRSNYSAGKQPPYGARAIPRGHLHLRVFVPVSGWFLPSLSLPSPGFRINFVIKRLLCFRTKIHYNFQVREFRSYQINLVNSTCSAGDISKGGRERADCPLSLRGTFSAGAAGGAIRHEVCLEGRSERTNERQRQEVCYSVTSCRLKLIPDNIATPHLGALTALDTPSPNFPGRHGTILQATTFKQNFCSC